MPLKVGEGRIKSMFEIRQDIFNYFSDIFKESNVDKPPLYGVVFLTLSDEDNLALTNPFTLQELDGVVAKCNGSKSHGSDGFSFSFFKRFWNLFKENLEIILQQFHRFASS